VRRERQRHSLCDSARSHSENRGELLIGQAISKGQIGRYLPGSRHLAHLEGAMRVITFDRGSKRRLRQIRWTLRERAPSSPLLFAACALHPLCSLGCWQRAPVQHGLNQDPNVDS